MNITSCFFFVNIGVVLFLICVVFFVHFATLPCYVCLSATLRMDLQAPYQLITFHSFILAQSIHRVKRTDVVLLVTYLESNAPNPNQNPIPQDTYVRTYVVPRVLVLTVYRRINHPSPLH